MHPNHLIYLAVRTTHVSAVRIERASGSNEMLLKNISRLNQTLPQNDLVAVVMTAEEATKFLETAER